MQQMLLPTLALSNRFKGSKAKSPYSQLRGSPPGYQLVICSGTVSRPDEYSAFLREMQGPPQKNSPFRPTRPERGYIYSSSSGRSLACSRSSASPSFSRLKLMGSWEAVTSSLRSSPVMCPVMAVKDWKSWS